MPKWLEKRIAHSAKKAGIKPGTANYKAYKYSTLRKIDKKKS
jgi:hypothetical protein